MKKSTRRILALALSLALVCTLAVTVFADTIIEQNFIPYTYDDIKMEHKIMGYEFKARAMISFKYTSGATIADDNFEFYYSGHMGYQHCPGDWLRPEYYVSERKDRSGEVRSTSTLITTNALPSGNVMIDAYMFFATQFYTTHATIYHNNPDRVYVGII